MKGTGSDDSLYRMNFFPEKKSIAFFAAIAFLILFVPTLTVGVLNYQSIGADMTKQVFDQRETVASLAASSVRLKLNKLVAIAETYASQPGVITDAASGNWNGARNLIIDLQNNPANYDSFIGRFLLLDKHGNVTVSFPGITSSAIGNPDVAIAEFSAPILQGNEDVFVSDVFQRGSSMNSNHIEILVPMRRASTLVGIVELSIPINEFSDFGKDVDVGDYGFVYLVDRTGHIISHPKYSSDGPIIDYSSLPIIQKLISGQSGVAINYNPFERQERAVAYEPVPAYGWGIVAQEPVAEAFAPRDSILQYIVYLIVALGLVELVAIWSILVLLGHKHYDRNEK